MLTKRLQAGLAVAAALLLLTPALAAAAETDPTIPVTDPATDPTLTTDPTTDTTNPGTGTSDPALDATDPASDPADPAADTEEEDDGPWGTVVSVTPILVGEEIVAYTIEVQQPDGTIQNVVVNPGTQAEFRAWAVDVASLQPGDGLRLNNTGDGIQLKIKREEQKLEGVITGVTPATETDPGSVTLLVDGQEVTVPLTGALAGLADELAPGAELELKSAGNLLFKAKVKTEQGMEVSFELRKNEQKAEDEDSEESGGEDGEDAAEDEDGNGKPDGHVNEHALQQGQNGQHLGQTGNPDQSDDENDDSANLEQGEDEEGDQPGHDGQRNQKDKSEHSKRNSDKGGNNGGNQDDDDDHDSSSHEEG